MRVLTTEEKGFIALTRVLAAATRKGYVAWLPTVQARYDVALERNGKFLRAQVKYADSKSGHCDGALRLDLKRRKRLYTKQEFDLLLVYIPKMDEVCCFGPEFFHNRHGLQLRLEPTKNGQKRGCVIAKDHIW